jgi:hypothetical protein
VAHIEHYQEAVKSRMARLTVRIDELNAQQASERLQAASL